MYKLITGGAGYIGSHSCIKFLEQGCSLVILDNLSNSSLEGLLRAASIAGVGLDIPVGDSDIRRNEGEEVGCDSRLIFIQGDIRNQALLRSLFKQFAIEAVVHFAGLKAVGESVEKPLMYYDNNVSGSVALFEVMAEFGCKRLVFSSSATVYGDPRLLFLYAKIIYCRQRILMARLS